MKPLNDLQVRMLMEERRRTGKISQAATMVGIHRNTARKYINAGKLPSEMAKRRSWRTRDDPFAGDWSQEIEPRLIDAPELEAKTLFDHLCTIRPDKYQENQLRTLQRRLRDWRAQCGPNKEVMFPQEHRPGEAMQTDFTWATSLGITIEGQPFPHMLCHSVLPYSNWEWATLCFSECSMALRTGVQASVFRLGRVPEWHQTDNTTAATHPLRPRVEKFNEEYLALMRHLGMKPRTIEVGEKHQNGDVEALNGSFKRRLVQHLAMRGSRDFESPSAYERWLEEVLEKANRLRTKKLREELDRMKVLQVSRLPEYRDLRVQVRTWSTIRVKNNTYSVPSRLIGEDVQVRLFSDRLEVFHRDRHQLTVERLLGEGKHLINYRHVIWSLVQKPGAFRLYKFRQDMFPTLAFRRAYDQLLEKYGQRRADLEYLRVLHLAASTMESDVEVALSLLMEEQEVPIYDQVKALVTPQVPSTPILKPFEVNLSSYDNLLAVGEGV
jgi:hypothetical protein